MPTGLQIAREDSARDERWSKEALPEQLVPSQELCELLRVEHSGKPIAVSEIVALLLDHGPVSYTHLTLPTKA